MFSVLVLINQVFKTYLQAVKKDLANKGVDNLILIASISWFSVLFLAGMFVLGYFVLPTDVMFYVFWLGVTFVATISFIFIVIGLQNGAFLSVNSITKVSFAVTAVYAVLFLGESLSLVQVSAIILAMLGCTLFFNLSSNLKETLSRNKGLFYVLFALFISPISLIFYKSATLYTESYSQFLTGRLLMDAIYYTLFLTIVYAFWHKSNPLQKITHYAIMPAGLLFMTGSAFSELLSSFLIYKLSASLFAVLGVISIPASYLIGKIRYKEKVETMQAIGSLLMVIGVFLFLSEDLFQIF